MSTGGAGRARKNARFGVLQIKGELKRLSVMGGAKEPP